MSNISRNSIRKRIHSRIRRKVTGTTSRPRLAVYFSNQHVYVQLIDDSEGRTIASASTMDKTFESNASNIASARKVGHLLAERAMALNITDVVYDRGGHLYHGKVKALADAAREAGLKF